MKTIIPILSLIFTAVFAMTAAAQTQRPNVVFILVDDLGVMDIGAFNPKTFYDTPNIDRLAAQGMRFTSGYAACNVCSPTRYSIMSGRYPVRSGITNFLAGTRSERFNPAKLDLFMPLEEVTLGEAFKEAGYQTALLGKWHLGNLKEYGPHLQGFDIVSGDWRYVAPDIGHLTLSQPVQRNNDPNFIETKTTQVVDDAMLVLDALKDEPFLLYLSFYQVHVPLGASEEFVAPYREKKKRLGLENDENLDFAPEEQVHVTENPRRTRIRQNHAVYAGMVSHTDACVGRVLEKLDELNLSENTIVVFMSDNGGLATAEGSPTTNLPFRCGKGWNYEGGIREPMIVRWPKSIKPDTVCDVPVISTDFYPTLLELADLPLKPQQHLDGVSFAPLLRKEKTALDRDALFWHYPHYSNQGGFPSSAVRMGDYKLIQRLEDGRVHLYNLKEDIGEQNDLAEKMPEKAAAMQKRLFEWYKETGARFLQPKDDQTPWNPGIGDRELGIGDRELSSNSIPNPNPQTPIPNVVVIFMDDMGYADIGAFGSEIPTPNLDRMAEEGRRFTNFIVPTAVCSASRAALMTGCIHRRVGIAGALGPRAPIGLNPDEETLAEICKKKDYATAIFGKWHLGDHLELWPLAQGFDEYFGIPYSNDMWPFHPENPKGYPPLNMVENNRRLEEVITPELQKNLTTWYTERAVAFIEKNKDRPFFLYVPHSMVHVPLFVSEKFEGKSGKGLFGDVIMEVDWSVGQILDTIRRLNLDKNTLVVFTSDNGPWLSYGNHVGSAAPLREGKGTSFEGGIREPTLFWYPGKIPAGTECDQLASTIDLLPTVAHLLDVPLPEKKIDGKDIRPLLFGEKDAVSPHTAFPIYYSLKLQAIRDNRWKLNFPHQYRTMEGQEPGKDGIPGKYTHKRATLALYDLKNDIGETTDVSSKHPKVVQRLQTAAEAVRADLGDGNQMGPGVRPAARIQK